MTATNHRHAWRVVDFLIVDGRPMMSRACDCGVTRAIPAWNRTWEPPNRPEQDGTADRGIQAPDATR